jgi:rare lipoprotein A
MMTAMKYRSLNLRCSNTFATALIPVLGAVLLGAVVASFAQAASPAQAAAPAQVVSPDGSTAASAQSASQRLSPKQKPALDRSGKKRVGKASFYAHMFEGRKMADGKIMDPTRNNAASRTLPLGTTAKVTNLDTGKSAVVTIQDRGPYVNGRIVDLSPATAQAIGITPRQGLAKVRVAPITVPLPNGAMMYGAAIEEARLASNERARQFPPVGW